jgi:HK97 family phage portal protein
MYQQSSAVATAVDIIAQEVEQIHPVVSTADGTLDDSHPILDLLRNPNDRNESYSDLIGELARNWLLTHDTFVYAGGTVSRPPVELFAVKPSIVNVTSGMNDGYPMRYLISDGSPAKGNYTQEYVRGLGYRYYNGKMRELWQIRGYSSKSSSTCGDSPLKAVCLDVYQQIRGRIHNVKLLENGARPTMVVSFEGESTSQEEFDARVQSIKEQLAGADNAGKIAVVDGGTAVSPVSGSNRDMDFAKLDEAASRAVYNRYKIPLPLISSEASTFNNMESAVAHLYDFAVLPAVNKILSSLSMFLMPRFGEDPRKIRLAYNEEDIRALRRRRVDELKARKELGVETINEIREGMPNREPIDGGDTLYQAANLVPVGQDIFTDDNATTAEEEARALIERDSEQGEDNA